METLTENSSKLSGISKLYLEIGIPWLSVIATASIILISIPASTRDTSKIW